MQKCRDLHLVGLRQVLQLVGDQQPRLALQCACRRQKWHIGSDPTCLCINLQLKDPSSHQRQHDKATVGAPRMHWLNMCRPTCTSTALRGSSMMMKSVSAYMARAMLTRAF